MNYPPPHHQDSNKDHMIEVIRTYPLATLISVKDEEPLVTHLPLMYNDGKLIGHIDKFNPQAELLRDGNKVTLIFGGPQSYISPSVYTTPQFPTWNYIKVHLKGTATSIEDSNRVKQSIVSMTDYLEAPEHKFRLPLDHPRMDVLIDYIKGFEISIIHWEGKFKLSQDKCPKDMQNAKSELIRANQQNIKDFVNRIF